MSTAAFQGSCTQRENLPTGGALGFMQASQARARAYTMMRAARAASAPAGGVARQPAPVVAWARARWCSPSISTLRSAPPRECAPTAIDRSRFIFTVRAASLVRMGWCVRVVCAGWRAGARAGVRSRTLLCHPYAGHRQSAARAVDENAPDAKSPAPLTREQKVRSCAREWRLRPVDPRIISFFALACVQRRVRR